MLDYLPLYPEVWEIIEECDELEQLHLIRAMSEYAYTGNEPSFASGTAERLLWNALRQRVDVLNKMVEQNRINGRKGGRPKSASSSNSNNQTKPNETEENRKKPEETELNRTEAHKTKTKDKDKDQNQNENEARAREAMFDRFWLEYPRHTAKQEAQKAFARLKPTEELLALMLAALKDQKQSAQWTRDGGQYIPHPSTWLNQHRWEDEATKVPGNTPVRTVTAQQYTQRDYSQEKSPDLPDWYLEALAREQKAARSGPIVEVVA